MLTLRDTFTLAWTKLRSRKLWTSLFLTLEILLFAAVLIFTAGVRGFTESLEAFNSQGLNGKYLVTAANVRSNPDLETDPDVMDLAEQLYQTALTEHQALAEQLGLSYSPDSEIAPTEYIDGQRALVVYSPYAQQAVNQQMSDYLLADQADLEAALQGYDYTAIYLQQQLNADGSVVNPQNGQEDLSRYSSSSGNQPVQTFSGLYVLDDALYADYLFTDLELDPDAIPVVLSVSDAEALLGLGSLSANASSAEKLQHFTALRRKRAPRIHAGHDLIRQLRLEFPQRPQQIRTGAVCHRVADRRENAFDTRSQMFQNHSGMVVDAREPLLPVGRHRELQLRHFRRHPGQRRQNRGRYAARRSARRHAENPPRTLQHLKRFQRHEPRITGTEADSIKLRSHN